MNLSQITAGYNLTNKEKPGNYKGYVFYSVFKIYADAAYQANKHGKAVKNSYVYAFMIAFKICQRYLRRSKLFCIKILIKIKKTLVIICIAVYHLRAKKDMTYE